MLLYKEPVSELSSHTNAYLKAGQLLARMTNLALP